MCKLVYNDNCLNFIILAFLIEEDSNLQQIASISNHLIQNISNFLNPNEEADEETKENLREV